jgi:2-polyprenyl-6-hydroxyphenyl methylase/3-demethylubiquinone-9 3-methyltransferase
VADVWASVPPGHAVDARAHRFARAVAAEPGSRVLDVGCGDGRLVGELAQAGVCVTGADPSRIAIERARAAVPSVPFEQIGAAGRLPFDDGRFDKVTCVHVLQHVDDTQQLMSEMRRVLRPGGLLVVAVPNNGRVYRTVMAAAAFERGHDPLQPIVRFYSDRSLAALLDAFGFEQIDVQERGGVPLVRPLLAGVARKPALG